MITMVLWELHNHHPETWWHETTTLLCPQVLWVGKLDSAQKRCVVSAIWASGKGDSKGAWGWRIRFQDGVFTIILAPGCEGRGWVPPVPTGHPAFWPQVVAFLAVS